LVEKETFSALIKNKFLLMTIAILAATISMATLMRPLLILVMGIGIPAAAIAGMMFFLTWTPPKVMPKPSLVTIKAEPIEVPADGKSRSTLTIELLDKEGKPIPAPADTEVTLAATKGKLETPVVTIPKGKETEQTVLVSSRESGPVTVSVDAGNLRSLSITLSFVEKARYCMHCGTRMLVTATSCPKCAKSPPSGVDTKLCRNCNAVIPAVARFCSECGAGQPEYTLELRRLE